MTRQIIKLLLLVGLIVLLTGCTPSKERQAFEKLRNRQDQIAIATKDNSTRQLPAEELPAKPSLSNYLAYAAAHNPELQAAFYRYKAALEAVAPARALPDPKFTYQYFIQEVETRVGPQQHSFGLAQTFPWFGKLQTRADISLEKAQAAGEDFEAARLKLFYEVKQAYYEHYYLSRAIDVTKENIELLGYIEQVARTKYKVATAEHHDVIRVQIEQGKLEDRLRALEDLRNPIMAKLNAALNRPPSAQLPWPGEAPAPQQLQANDHQVLLMLREANPQLKSLDHQILAEEKAVELAGKDYFPDLTLGVNYIDTDEALAAGTPDSGKDPVVLMASINLPIWHDKCRANRQAARTRRLAVIKQKMGTVNALVAQVQLALYDFRDAQRKISLYRDSLIPKAEQSFKVTQTAFMSDKADFLDLIDTQRMLLEFQLLYERALTDSAQRLAQLEMLLGQELPTKDAPQAE